MINIGILGCGTVGSGLARLIEKNHGLVQSRTGLDLRIHKILVQDETKSRNGLERWITTDPDEILTHPEVDIVVELIGGTEPARQMITHALRNRKHVVTANKAVLAKHGPEIFTEARRHRVRVGFEGSVCGGIPIIRILQEGLVANAIESVTGIVNGTTNFILTRMAREGSTLEETLVEAQKQGLCERDATLDLNGSDAAQKLAILVRLAFGTDVQPDQIHTEGIERVAPEELSSAREFGYILKLVALARRTEHGLECRVHPAFLPQGHPLADVADEDNGLYLKGDAVGGLFFSGKGAGSLPTASAVLSDIIDVARSLTEANHHDPLGDPASEWGLAPDFEMPVYIRVPVQDRPGVIGQIATILGHHDISIRQASAVLDPRQPGTGNVRILTHRSSNRKVRSALDEISRLPLIQGTPVLIRILED